MARALLLAALQEQEGQSVVGTRQVGVGLERLPVVADRLVRLPGAAEGDGEVLEDPGLVGMVTQRQAVAGDRGVVVPLPLEGQRLVQVVQPLRLDRPVTRGRAAQDSPEETHEPPR